MPLELTLEAPLTGQKCAHGVRISPGDSIARYCSICNPHHDRVLALAMARKKPPSRVYGDEKTLDVEDFLLQPVGTRLAMLKEELFKSGN